VACGFGTAYEAIVRAEINGRDAVLVTGLGPVGLAAGLLAKAMGASTSSATTAARSAASWR
jgi:D-arabinose 1-dehydrogenase-like Zn-dependent alcohol dehydrogenase